MCCQRGVRSVSMCCRSLQDVQIWFQPNAAARFAPFLPRSDSQDAFGESASGSQCLFTVSTHETVNKHFSNMGL